VASLVIEHGGGEDQVLAALLHDVLEDGGASYARDIEASLGPEVLALVEACSDGTAEAKASVAAEDKQADWKARKNAYLARLDTESPEALLVTGCDKLHNALSILGDLERIGPAVFDRFTGGLDGTLWYYATAASRLEARGCPVAPALSDVVARIRASCGA
jgi:(p)ppGpp synthase/HD superfamily hydrolase